MRRVITTTSLFALLLLASLPTALEDFDVVLPRAFKTYGGSAYLQTFITNVSMNGTLYVNDTICIWNTTAWDCLTGGWNVSGGGGGGGNLSWTEGPYVYDNTTTVFFNESYLNLTIDYRSTNLTYWSDEVYINKNASDYFNLNLTALNDSLYVQWVNSSGSEVYNGTFNETENYFIYNSTPFLINFNSTLLNLTIDARAGSTAGAPNQSVQFNYNDAFAGDAEFTWDNAYNTLVIVGNGTFGEHLVINGTYGNTSFTGNNILFNRPQPNYITATNALGSLLLGAGGTSGALYLQYNALANTLYLNNVGVGVKKTNPSVALDVAGDVNVSANVTSPKYCFPDATCFNASNFSTTVYYADEEWINKNATNSFNFNESTLAVDYYNKSQVDGLVSGIQFDLFLYNTSSGEIPTYNVMNDSIPTGPQKSIVVSVPAADTLIQEFVANATINVLEAGIYDAHLHLNASTLGNKDVVVYWKGFVRYSNGTETLLVTSESSPVLSSSELEYDLHGVLSSSFELDASDKLVAKFYATPSGAGGDPDVWLLVEGDTLSRFVMRGYVSAFNRVYLKLGGDNANQEINISGYNFTTGGNVTALNYCFYGGGCFNASNLTGGSGSGEVYNGTFNETDGTWIYNATPFNVSLNITAVNNSLYLQWQNVTYDSDEQYINENASHSFNLNVTALNETLYVQWLNETTGEVYNGTFNETEGTYVYNSTPFLINFNITAVNDTLYVQWVNETGSEVYNGTFNSTSGGYVYNDTDWNLTFNETKMNDTIDDRLVTLWLNASEQQIQIDFNAANITLLWSNASIQWDFILGLISNDTTIHANLSDLWVNASAQQVQIDALAFGETYNGTFNDTEQYYVYNDTPFTVKFNSSLLNLTIETYTDLLWDNASVQWEFILGLVSNDTTIHSNLSQLWINASNQQEGIDYNAANVTLLWTNASQQWDFILGLVSNDTTIHSNLSQLWVNASAQQAQIDALAFGEIYNGTFNDTEQYFVYNDSPFTVKFNSSLLNLTIETYTDLLWSNASTQWEFILGLVSNDSTLFSNASVQWDFITGLVANDTVIHSNLSQLWVNASNQQVQIDAAYSPFYNDSQMIAPKNAIHGVNASWFNATNNVTTPVLYGGVTNKQLFYLYASSFGATGAYLRLGYAAGFYLYAGQDSASAGADGEIRAGNGGDNLNGGALTTSGGVGGDDTTGAGNAGDGGDFYGIAGNGGNDQLGVNAAGGNGGRSTLNAGDGGITQTNGFTGGNGGEWRGQSGQGGVDLSPLGGIGGNSGDWYGGVGVEGASLAGVSGNAGEGYFQAGSAGNSIHSWGGASGTGVGILNFDLQSRARVYLENPQVVVCGGPTQILFDVSNYDNQNEMGGAGVETYTARHDGVVSVDCGYWMYNEEPKSGEYILIYLYLNGAPYTAQIENVQAFEPVPMEFSIDVSDKIPVQQNDVIECWADCSLAGGAMALTTGSPYTYMAIHKSS